MLFWIFVILIALGIAVIVSVSKISGKYSHQNDNNKIVEFLYFNDEEFIFT